MASTFRWSFPIFISWKYLFLDCTGCCWIQVMVKSFLKALYIFLKFFAVFEFFLQTLVKIRLMSQQRMLVLQRLLMLSATFPAVTVVTQFVDWHLAIFSLLLNFGNRKHDWFNTLLILMCKWVYEMKWKRVFLESKNLLRF